MKTPAFINELVVADRVVELSVEFTVGFMQLAEQGYRFPCLERLCLAITYLPTDATPWRSVAKPQWSSLGKPWISSLPML
ncbi:hypothetical protein AURDEDRAFT_161647 [Auricularia subglabra TFB-10046 SS5]|nr:hypothetical protein AURDEDRAFT_161647 [Auricularia subglabra TFB-10046 SS5]